MFYKLQELFWIVNDSERSWGIFRDSSWIPRRFCVNFKDPGGFFRDLFDPRRSLGDFFERFSRILPDWTRNPRNLLGFPTIFDDPVKIGSRIQGFLRSWTILLRNSQEFFRDPQIFSTIPDDPVGFFKHGSKLQPKSNGFWDPRRPWWIIQAILKTKPTIQGSFCHARRSWGILSGGQGCSTPPERNPKLTLGEHQTSQRLTDPEGFFKKFSCSMMCQSQLSIQTKSLASTLTQEVEEQSRSNNWKVNQRQLNSSAKEQWN